MARLQGEAILFEMLRSFTTLARTLNLSKAVRELGTTRQTVRRHIDLLEENMGESLFNIEDRQYHLTAAGRHSLPEASELLVRGEAWLKHQTGHVNGLFHLSFEQEDGFSYHIQQHPLSDIWRMGSPFFQHCFRAWADSRGHIEHDAFSPIRDHWMIFRERDNHWICVEVGKHSSFASWVGWEWERSSIGRDLTELPGRENFATLSLLPFQDVKATHAVRYDHIHSQMVRGNDPAMVPITFQRLLLGCQFPDDSFAMVSIVERTHNIEIEGLSREEIESMPHELIMNTPEINQK
jgi:hypothetical protein